MPSSCSGPPRLQDGEITVQDYAVDNGVSYWQAFQELQLAHNEGNLTRRKILHDGRWKWAYGLPDHSTDQGDLDD